MSGGWTNGIPPAARWPRVASPIPSNLKRADEDRRRRPDRTGVFVRLGRANHFRDAGGQSLPPGSRVRRGMLFRANRLSKLTDADHAALAPLGIRLAFAGYARDSLGLKARALAVYRAKMQAPRPGLTDHDWISIPRRSMQ